MPSGSGSCTRIECTSELALNESTTASISACVASALQVHVKGLHADLFALFDLHRHVARARRIVTHQQGAETRDPSVGRETRDPFGQFHLDSLGESFTVE